MLKYGIMNSCYFDCRDVGVFAARNALLSYAKELNYVA
jgi:hypothetical protein